MRDDDDEDDEGRLLSLDSKLDKLATKTKDLEGSAKGFARAMTQAFSSSVTGGKQFDDVLKSLALRMSDMAVKMAFKPLENIAAKGLSGLFSQIFGNGDAGEAKAAASGSVKPFASGGVIGTPTYFPMMDGGVGLAGEAGPEAIMPLRRGADGRLGVAAQGGGGNVTIHIATPDADSFRRSESYVAGQIARAVARGRRTM